MIPGGLIGQVDGQALVARAELKMARVGGLALGPQPSSPPDHLSAGLIPIIRKNQHSLEIPRMRF